MFGVKFIADYTAALTVSDATGEVPLLDSDDTRSNHGGVSEGLTTYFTYFSAMLPCAAGLATPTFCAARVNNFAGYYYDAGEARN